ncbi:formin-like protein 5 [Populus alba x Populus x berolinensis]|uniref:Formin-like protein n=1 Tax=Populus alba x Populus x berolinensis TaxID=444605 RepID=A0AAD6M7G0_9ROSI|nr:formin-like protein 5 [Populus alba x Populus x berolinensis]
MLTRMNQQQVVRMKSSCFSFLVILLCASVVVSLDYKGRTEEVFLRQLVNPATGDVDKDTAELLCIICKVDLIRLKEAGGNNFFSPEETFSGADELSSEGWSMAKENSQRLIKVLHPQLKETILDCIRKNSYLFHVSGDEGGADIYHSTSLNSLFHRHAGARRNLLQSIAEAPAPAPAVGSLIPSPAPAPDLALSPVSTPNPAPSPQELFFTQPSPPPPSLSENSSGGPASVPNIDPDNGKNNNKTVLIAVLVTAAVTFVLAALFFLFCTKACRRGSGARRNDERPLLSISLSDYSVGSTLKPFGVGNSIIEEKHGHQSFGNVSNHEKRGTSLESNFYNSDAQNVSLDESLSLGVVSGAAKSSTDNKMNILVPPPPGRTGSNPFLKPPPGRAEPLPHEPPANLRPPPSRAGPTPSPPPPPPPPAPPAPAKSSSSVPPPPRGSPPPPPIAPGVKPGPRPPPPPPGGSAPRPPPPMPPGPKVPRPPLGSKRPSNSASSEGAGLGDDADAPKTKLKPFFWDKVLANPDHSMVWHQIKSGSFQFNEEMIETLFGYAPDKNKNEHKKESSSQDPSPQYIQILDPKKAQNLSILLRALNVTIEEVCDALREGNELPVELLQNLLRMAPTADEELKLRLYSGELSQLGPAERFLKALVDIPFAFKRLEALLFMCILQEEVATTKESFETLEVACKELRNSRLFLKLLEAVLKTGNRMNDGTFRGGAQAFKLDTLLKLSDVKGIDGKTTLLHFVVQEIIRSEGVRAARAGRESRSISSVSVKTDDLLEDISPDTEDNYSSLGLQVVSQLSSELENVKRAAVVDADSLTGSVAKLGQSVVATRNFLNKDMKNLEENSGFHETLKSFVQNAEVDIMSLLEEEKRIVALVKSTGDYFHGNAGKDEGLRLFIVVRDFLIILDKVCKEVGEAQKRSAKTRKKEASTASSPSHKHQQPSPDIRQRLFPAIAERRMGDTSSSSDDEG